MTGRAFESANAEATAALRDLVASLGPDDFSIDVGDGWTVSIVLAHLAFWDRWQVSRWEAAARDGLTVPGDLPDAVADLVNATLQATWWTLPGGTAAQLAVDAAISADSVVAALPDTAATAAIATGRGRLVERSHHRHEHIAQIRRALWEARAQG